MDLEKIQSALRDQDLDGWLFYDHHHRDPIAYRVLGLPEKLHVTRRWYYLVPAVGAPRKLVHRVEPRHLDALPGAKNVYSSWQEQHARLKELLSGVTRLAMQYSRDNLIPYIGLVDAGTIELIRGFGKEISGSGDLVSVFEAAWTERQIASHYAARDIVDDIMAASFQEIGRRVRSGGVNEYEMQQWIAEAFTREGLVFDDPAIVGVNANSGNPHYSPKQSSAKPVREGDFVLLDMWGKNKDADAVYYDITWVGVVGTPSERHQEVFQIVRDARDKAFAKVKESFAAKKRIEGWEVDAVTRESITQAGFGEYFIHRTGHSIGTEVHGNGANMDDLETKDERAIMSNTCFSVEPGIYLPEFGVRSEFNVLVRGNAPEVTGKIQTELVRI